MPPQGATPWALLAVYLLVTFVTSLVNPVGEGYDEWAHFAYIRHLATERALPASGQRLVPEIEWDATHHPPLYHLVGALATSWVDMSDNLRPYPNPYLTRGQSLNAYVHTAVEAWPYRGSVLGIHVARGVSTAMGLLTLLITHRIGLLLFPRRHGLAAAGVAITAYMPQFVFTHSIVTNDAAVTLFATLSLWLMLRLVREPSAGRGVALWLAIVAAFLSKANAVALIPVGAVVTGAVLITHSRRLDRRARMLWLGGGALALAAAMGILLAWERWNAYLAGHHSSVLGALNTFILPALTGTAEQRAALFDWSIVPSGLLYTYRTFWAAFGMGNVPADTFYYWGVTAVSLLAGAGVVRALWLAGRRQRSSALIVGATALALLAPPLFLIPVSKLVTVSPGRYLMPLAPIAGLGLAAGLASLAPTRWVRRAPWLLALCLLAVSLVAPWRYILPAYARPPRVTKAQVQERAGPLEVRFGAGIALVGYTLETDSVQPGGEIGVTLYWQCLEPIAEDYAVSVQALDPGGAFYGGTVNFTGRGTYPTSLWQPGEIIADYHTLHLGDDLLAPTFVRLQVDLSRPDSDVYLPVAAPAELAGANAAQFGRLRVAEPGPAKQDAAAVTLATYGDAIALEGFAWGNAGAAGGQISLSLTWRCLQPPDRDYTVFVLVRDTQGNVIAQGDGPPLGGRYPTGLWREDDRVIDTRTLVGPDGTPPGSYSVAVGWYLLETLERLPASDGQGAPLAHGEYLLPLIIPPAGSGS